MLSAADHNRLPPKHQGLSPDKLVPDGRMNMCANILMTKMFISVCPDELVWATHKNPSFVMRMC